MRQKQHARQANILGIVVERYLAVSGFIERDTLHLLSSSVSLGSRRFVIDCQALVEDRLVFEGQITGMVQSSMFRP